MQGHAAEEQKENHLSIDRRPAESSPPVMRLPRVLQLDATLIFSVALFLSTRAKKQTHLALHLLAPCGATHPNADDIMMYGIASPG